MVDTIRDPDAAETTFGPFRVSAGHADVEAFRAAIGGGAAIPFTFPVRWLAEPPVRAALAAAFAVDDEIPIHEGQSFDYERPLEIDAAYLMTLRAARTSAPEKLTVRAAVADGAGTVYLRMEMVLRLIAAPERRT